MVCNFLELDTGAMNLHKMREKFRRYEAWARSDVGQAFLVDLYRTHGATNARPTFRILIVADDRMGTGGRARVLDLLRVIVGFSASVRDRIWCVAVADLRSYECTELPLTPCVWIRARESKMPETQKDTLGRTRHESPRQTRENTNG